MGIFYLFIYFKLGKAKGNLFLLIRANKQGNISLRELWTINKEHLEIYTALFPMVALYVMQRSESDEERNQNSKK